MSKTDSITLTIDGNPVEALPGTTLMEAIALSEGHTPVICFHEATTSEGLCRLCVVEVSGWRTLAPACITQAADGMEITTGSERVLRARRTILEMLNASVDLSEAPEIQEFLDQYQANPDRFAGHDYRGKSLIDDNPFFVRDYQKCLLCWRCVQACGDDLQFTYALSVGGRGFESQISTFFESPLPETTCVFCGNCVAVCPTNALKGKTEYYLDQGLDYQDIRLKKREQRKQQRSREVADE